MDSIVPDSEARGLVARLPAWLRPFWLLARLDRPIGAWLLFWPGAWAIALAGAAIARWELLAWFALGAVAMRGAGCVYNDIVDRDLDRKVARTAARPLASGAVSPKAAWAWLLALCLVGLVVLVRLPATAQLTALASLALVAAYPYMKRITWWPQAWLGLVFAWAALVGWPAATGGFAPAGLLLYAGTVAWVIGYDTIYALQDVEDDALAGVKSSARALGRHVKPGIAICYAVAVACWAAAIWQVRPEERALTSLAPAAIHLFHQVAQLDRDDPAQALVTFRANRFLGLLVFLACLVVGQAG